MIKKGRKRRKRPRFDSNTSKLRRSFFFHEAKRRRRERIPKKSRDDRVQKAWEKKRKKNPSRSPLPCPLRGAQLLKRSLAGSAANRDVNNEPGPRGSTIDSLPPSPPPPPPCHLLRSAQPPSSLSQCHPLRSAPRCSLFQRRKRRKRKEGSLLTVPGTDVERWKTKKNGRTEEGKKKRWELAHRDTVPVKRPNGNRPRLQEEGKSGKRQQDGRRDVACEA